MRYVISSAIALLLSSASAQTYSNSTSNSTADEANRIPTAIFHGFGDECDFYGMQDFVEKIADQTGSYAECIEIGSGSLTSIFENFEL